MSANPKFITLLTKLLEVSQAGRVKWEETPAEYTYRILLDHRAFVHVSRQLTDFSENFLYEATVVNTDGKPVEGISVADTSADTSGTSEIGLLRDLFDVARRSAMDVDGMLDGLIQTVEKNR